MSESTWNSSNGDMSESVGDTSVSRPSTLTSTKGGFVAGAGAASDHQKEADQTESSLAGAGSASTSGAKTAAEEASLRGPKRQEQRAVGSVHN